MMPQNAPEFNSFGDAVLFFYKYFSASAPDRFERYLVAAGGRHMDAIALYRWNLELCEALLPCLHTAELTLRNSIHLAMVMKYLPATRPHFPDNSHPDEWWFDSEFNGKPLLKSGDYEKVEDVCYRLRRIGKTVTTSRVVAALPFGFWVELLNSDYEHPIVVPTLMTTMKTLKTGDRTQGWLRDTFGKFKDLRNRVTHHEPIFERTDLNELRKTAWAVCNEVQPFFVYPLHPMCRFKSVASIDFKEQTKMLKESVAKDLFEKYKTVEPTA